MSYECKIVPLKDALRWKQVVDMPFVDLAMLYAKPDITKELPEKLLRDVEGYPIADAMVALAFVLSQLACAVGRQLATADECLEGKDVFDKLVKVAPQ